MHRLLLNNPDKYQALTNKSYMHIKITMLTLASLFSAGEERIELPLTVLETAALPLYYSPIYSSVNSPTNAIITQYLQNRQVFFQKIYKIIKTPKMKSVCSQYLTAVCRWHPVPWRLRQSEFRYVSCNPQRTLPAQRRFQSPASPLPPLSALPC